MNQQDLNQIKARGISEQQIEHQLEQIKNGFPFLKLEAAAAIGKGIMAPTDDEVKNYEQAWNEYKAEGHKIVKFVPASGAASRMFKNMFAFLSAPYDVPTTDFEKHFFENIKKFAFREALCEKCRENEGKGIKKLMGEGNYKAVVANLLEAKGLNYGQLPKGLLLFHEYSADEVRTPMEEHLVEAALYASSNGEANVHFTVSHDHLELFKQKVAEKADFYAEKFGVKYNISFSEQKPSTDTIAANPDNTPFRNEDGSLLFRPGGHGALIQNLNEIDADVVFVKNIDNVVPDRLKADTVTYKQVIAGILVTLQKRAFKYLNLLDSGLYNHEKLEEIIRFVQRDLCCRRADNDGTVSLQILESSQIDTNNEEYMKMFTQGTHFNPVDLVCATKNYKGEPFNLPDYVDPTTGFISSKSKNGKDLKALELPGLWNGAMSDWNTVFVEVPLSTFNPVKTVNDLLRDQHQAVIGGVKHEGGCCCKH